ncbi:unnamed protein product [Microthlaspi erraticum]|uniref:Subtilisin-like protease fibronectin type-III domain-containing protein n=1 Tax=Microthlaspi erraticum TaxID=1685480 RepID=A0A6D2L801_9BRAS|nr:unnamed protein product [Microthlaspi erraticum]
MPMVFVNKTIWHKSCVRAVSPSATVLYSYNKAIDGFAARLTDGETEALRLQPGVVSIFPERSHRVQTTRSPFFLGLDDSQQELFPSNGSASNVVIGVIDTGVWPESKSFDDRGYGPTPRTWKGECEEGTNFTASLCNRKLIGARFFLKGYEAEYGPLDESKESKSPRDVFGHGTHTSSTAAGSVVKGASFLGYAPGVARGIAPRARVAIYKACWEDGRCVTSDLLAAVDKAIEDNVDVLSLSVGFRANDYHSDALAIGALAAVERGIFVSAAAGNEGPSESTLINVAPWITTVGASTIDRDFPGTVILGNGKSFAGYSSLFKERHRLPNNQIPLLYSEQGGDFAGKLKLVDMGSGGTEKDENEAAKSSGPLGIIYANTELDGEEIVARYRLLPSIAVGKESGDQIRNYVLTDSNPTAMIVFKGTVVNVKPSPVVAGFSSRGPNPITPAILKPDLVAPGVNILAAWTRAIRPEVDTQHTPFFIQYGTSMACPHVSGIAALLKAAHPDWTPAAIRSALMTTARRTGNDGEPIIDSAGRTPSTPLAHGAGHVSPVAALNPGLIYDLTADDYIDFLCASNYTAAQIRTVARRDFTCNPKKTYRIADLNYPSFAVRVNHSLSEGGAYKYTRVVTSVGGAGTYTVKVVSDKMAVNISVEPAILKFRKVNEKISYTVTFTVKTSMPSGTNSFESIEWSDGRHVVRNPVALSWPY